MKWDRGTLFIAFTGMVLIVLIIALTAVVVTNPTKPVTEPLLTLPSSVGDQSPAQNEINSLPESASSTYRTANYPGISRLYTCKDLDYSINLYTPAAGSIMDTDGDLTSLFLNGDGTVTVRVNHVTLPYLFSMQHRDVTVTGGHWYKVKGKGHSFYLDADIYDSLGPYDFNIKVKIPAQVVDLYDVDGCDSGVQITYGTIRGSFNGGTYNNWDAGYATMGVSVDSLAPLIDACVPADVARPFIESGYTGEQAVPFIYYNMPIETADYYKKQGISGALCGPYYAAGVSREDTLAYLDSGFTADQIMPYVRAGVPESDVLTYLGAGFTYDRVKPFIDANVSGSDILAYLRAGATYNKAKPYIDVGTSASIAIPYITSTYTQDQCMPFARASISLTKARPFLLLNIPSDQAVIYINNSISATTAKPYVDAGVPAEKAVDEIKQGIPPTV